MCYTVAQSNHSMMLEMIMEERCLCKVELGVLEVTFAAGSLNYGCFINTIFGVSLGLSIIPQLPETK